MVDGFYEQYATPFYGNFLFHSVCYSAADPSTLLTDKCNILGSPASLGCVRLQTADAKWIYENCDTGTKVTIYDGADPRLLGKPDKLVAEITPETDNSWDPSNPRESNPWHDLLTSETTFIQAEAVLIARASLDKVGWEVDYIITHCRSTLVQNAMSGGLYQADARIDFLAEVTQQ